MIGWNTDMEGGVTNEEINAKINGARKQPWDETRCRICGWPVRASFLDGCTFNSCSQRPAPSRRADDNSRDWTGSEDASAVLLEEMSAGNAYVWVEWDINEWCVTWLATTSEDQDPPTEYNNRDRKAAIALAWLKWKESQ